MIVTACNFIGTAMCEGGAVGLLGPWCALTKAPGITGLLVLEALGDVFWNVWIVKPTQF